MNRAFHPLAVSLAPPGTYLWRPTDELPRRVRLDSPATDVMTDLARITPVVIDPDATLEKAQDRMRSARVRLLFVIGAQDRFLGLVTLNDVKGERPLRYQQEMGVSHTDVVVGDIMTPVDRLETLSMHDVADSVVGDIIDTLKRTGRQHALVIETMTDGPRIRGLFSARQIGRQLGVQINTSGIAYTFAELETALAH